MNQGGRDWKGTERNTKRKRKRVRVKERESEREKRWREGLGTQGREKGS